MYFFRKYKNRMIVALVTIILLIIIGISSNKSKLPPLSKFSNLANRVFQPVEKISYKMTQKITGSFGSVTGYFKLANENKALKEQLEKYKEENLKLENIIGKEDYLRAEYLLLEATEYELIGGQVISKEANNWYNTFTIDKGSKDGIEEGDTVIQAVQVEQDLVEQGLVGRISQVSENSSKVVALIDESNKVAFKIIRTQDGGVLSGSLKNELEGYLYDSKADVIVGDQIYSSGLGQLFKKEIYIGEVTEVNQAADGLNKSIKIKPAIDFQKIYQVHIIKD